MLGTHVLNRPIFGITDSIPTSTTKIRKTAWRSVISLPYLLYTAASIDISDPGPLWETCEQ